LLSKGGSTEVSWRQQKKRRIYRLQGGNHIHVRKEKTDRTNLYWGEEERNPKRGGGKLCCAVHEKRQPNSGREKKGRGGVNSRLSGGKRKAVRPHPKEAVDPKHSRKKKGRKGKPLTARSRKKGGHTVVEVGEEEKGSRGRLNLVVEAVWEEKRALFGLRKPQPGGGRKKRDESSAGGQKKRGEGKAL